MTRDTIIGTMGGLLVVLGGLLIMLDGVLINQKSQLNTRIEDLGCPTSSATDRPRRSRPARTTREQPAGFAPGLKNGTGDDDDRGHERRRNVLNKRTR